MFATVTVYKTHTQSHITPIVRCHVPCLAEHRLINTHVPCLAKHRLIHTHVQCLAEHKVINTHVPCLAEHKVINTHTLMLFFLKAWLQTVSLGSNKMLLMWRFLNRQTSSDPTHRRLGWVKQPQKETFRMRRAKLQRWWSQSINILIKPKNS